MHTPVQLFKKRRKITELSDEEVVKLIVESQRADDFEVLYNRYVTIVYRRCLSLTNNEDLAKDLTHDIFLKVFINLSKFEGKSKFSTWLYRIVFNFCMDHLRKGIKEVNQIDELAEINDVDDELNEKQLLEMKVEQLESVLKLISIEDKSVLLMKYQDDHSIKEMAEILDLSESAVKMRIKRAKAKAVDLFNELKNNN